MGVSEGVVVALGVNEGVDVIEWVGPLGVGVTDGVTEGVGPLGVTEGVTDGVGPLGVTDAVGVTDGVGPLGVTDGVTEGVGPLGVTEGVSLGVGKVEVTTVDEGDVCGCTVVVPVEEIFFFIIVIIKTLQNFANHKYILGSKVDRGFFRSFYLQFCNEYGG